MRELTGEGRALKIGTRRSPLALWQANHVRAALVAAFPKLEAELVEIQTQGDKILDVPLAKIGDKGLFTREIERALLDGRVDLAVHSLKDLPTTLPEGLRLGAALEREDARDAMVTRGRRDAGGTRRQDASGTGDDAGGTMAPRSLADLPEGATVATSSARRRAQLLHARADLRIVDVRGNIGTRLAKFDASDWDAFVVARAALERLGLGERIGFTLESGEMLSAVSQGALGIEVRSEDAETRAFVEALGDLSTERATAAERAFLHRLEGGCQIPVAAFARVSENSLRLEGLVVSLDGRLCYRDRIEGSALDAESLGESLAERLLEAGASEILESIRNGE